MDFPDSIKNLINQLTKLPAVGPKTAERYVFYLLKQSQNDLEILAKNIAELKKNINTCQLCLSISNNSPCPICSDKNRNKNQLCLVEDTKEMLIIENTKQYQGQYFVLGGVINALEKIGPEQLNVKNLISKIKNNNFNEIILALNPNLEGETTCLYLQKLFKAINYKGQVSRLARGLPTGADIEYADEITIGNALKFRNKIN